MLTVTGEYFVAVHDKDYRCRFGGPTAEVDRQATLVNITTLICMSPPRPWLLAQTVDDEETLHRLVFDDGSALRQFVILFLNPLLLEPQYHQRILLPLLSVSAWSAWSAWRAWRAWKH